MSIIAVDFDGIIVESAYPEIGKPRLDVINALIKRKMHGDKLILWTCRENRLLDEAVGFCRNMGLVFDAVNENLDFMIDKYGDSRKVGADYYLDDRNVDAAYIINGMRESIKVEVAEMPRKKARVIRR